MRRIAFVLMLVVVAAALAACSTASPIPLESSATTTTPVESATVVQPPSATPGSVASADPATPVPASADPPSSAPTPVANMLTLWHSFAADSPETTIVNDLIAQAQQSTPDLKIAAVAIPGDEIINRFETEAAAGGGPDLLLASNDSLSRQARAGLLRELDAAVEQQAGQYLPNALDSMRVGGKLYGMPAALSTIGLYYNTAQVPSPPRSTGDLLNAVKAGTSLVLIRSAFHNFGFFGAFGGRLFDENGRCIADGGGFAEALSYLRELKAAGAQIVASGREAEALFKEGQAALTINGSWLLADYRAALGEQLGVAPMPAGPAGPAKPLLGGTGIYVNAATTRAEQATALGLLLTGQQAQQRFVEQGAFIPSNPNLTIANPALASFFESAKAGTPAPQRPELDRFWQPFDNALAEVLETDADPLATVQAACAAMNEANGR
jgi:arabinogalactan oligomer / maltooligosaccharide transport system substrate-binding protein